MKVPLRETAQRVIEEWILARFGSHSPTTEMPKCFSARCSVKPLSVVMSRRSSVSATFHRSRSGEPWPSYHARRGRRGLSRGASRRLSGGMFSWTRTFMA
jgi:hypothetical protein